MNLKLTLEERVTALEQQCVVEGCNNEMSQKHHVIPIIHSEYDRDEPFNPITNPCLNLCDDHHDMIHQIEKNHQYKLSEAIRRGQQRAKANGVKFGRKSNLTEDIIRKVLHERHKLNKPIKKIATEYSIGVGTVYKILDTKTQMEMDF